MAFFNWKWAATAAVAAALLGCGGQDGDVDAAAGVSVQVAEVPAGLKVTASLAGTALPAPLVSESTQYAFSADIASGPHAGQALSGTLVLHGEGDAAGGLQIEGTLVGTARIAATPASLALFNTGVQSLRANFRARVEAASADLLAAMTAGAAGSIALSAAQSNALLQFQQSFSALGTQYRGEVATLNVQILAEAAAEDDEAAAPNDDLEVSGTVDAQGRIELRLILADRSVLLASGATAADGSLSGNLAGPDSGDLGTWIATAQPMPAAAPVGNAVVGLARYTALCADCHTANVRSNVFNVAAANNVARLDAALAGIGSMTFLDPVLSAQDRLDIAAYVLSAR